MEGRQCGQVQPVARVSGQTSAVRPLVPQSKGLMSQCRVSAFCSWYYVPPNGNPGDKASKLGVDHFLSEEEAIKNASRWRSNAGTADASQGKGVENPAAEVPVEEAGNLAATDGDDPLRTPRDRRTKPQDPALPLPSSPASKSHMSPSSRTDPYEWQHLWPLLQKYGWAVVKAGRYNSLHDWYYVRPRRDPGDAASQLGRHYFARAEDVVRFVRSMDNGEGGSSRKSRKSIGGVLAAFEEAAAEA